MMKFVYSHLDWDAQNRLNYPYSTYPNSYNYTNNVTTKTKLESRAKTRRKNLQLVI